MGRTLRMMKQINKSVDKRNQKNNKLRSESCKKKKCEIKQSDECMKELFVVLEDKCTPGKERSVLGDKTNCTRLSNSPGQPDQKDTSPALQSKIGVLVADKSHQSKKSSVGNLSLVENMQGSSLKADTSVKKCSKSSDKRAYLKVERESVQNRNKPIEKKLAEYNFEVDENEIVVKTKKKKIKRKRRIHSPDVYHASSKIEQQCNAKRSKKYSKPDRKRKVLCENSVQSNFVTFKKDCADTSFSSNNNHDKNVPKDQLSQSIEKKNNNLQTKDALLISSKCTDTSQKCRLKCSELKVSDKYPLQLSNSTNSPQELCLTNKPRVEILSPVATSNNSITQTANKTRSGSRKLAELQVSSSENVSPQNLEVSQSTPTRLIVQEVSCNDESGRAQKRLPLESRSSENRIHSSHPCKEQPCIDAHLPLSARSSCLTSDNQKLSRSGTVSSPKVYPASRYSNIFQSPFRSSANLHISCEMAEKWTVDNNFGFDEDDEVSEIQSPLSEFSFSKGLRRIGAISSTPMIPSRRKLDNLGFRNTCKNASSIQSTVHAKEKSEKTPMLTLEASTGKTSHEKENTNSDETAVEAQLPQLVSSELSTSTAKEAVVPPAPSPFAYSLKESKLDFSVKSSQTPSRKESPLLFKDDEDKTPIHFKDPPRRSYVRSIRRKMKPIGEVESDNEDEVNHCHNNTGRKAKKSKKDKLEEKEANKWMESFNHQCEEVDDFELCIE